jgi:HAD superfamily phosphoserine phosphatase-like hydrolase
LRYRKAIPTKNYLLWLKEAARLLPRGINSMLQSNKMYLKGVQSLGEGEASAPSHREAGRHLRWPVPAFFQAAIQRVAWHAMQGHLIIIVSGALEPLARAATRALEAELACRGRAVRIRVYATRLEEIDGKWTGRILGEAMFGKAKARAIKKLAEEMHLDLERCRAYGDSVNDRWMLAEVGKPTVVNPSHELAEIAREQGWAGLRWNEARSQTQRHREKEGQKQTRPANESLLQEQLQEIEERSLQAARWI